MPPEYVAFFSYTHADDDLDGGILSTVRGQLELRLRAALGQRQLHVFQDRDDLSPGDVWEERLTKALDEAVYLITVITPSFFTSDYCRREFMRFWDRWQADPNSARIIPLYWRRHLPLDGIIPSDDPLLVALRKVQYADWQDVRQRGLADQASRDRIESLVDDLAERYARLQHELAPIRRAAEEARQQAEAQARREREEAGRKAREQAARERAESEAREARVLAEAAERIGAAIAAAADREALFRLWQQHPERQEQITARLGALGYVYVRSSLPGKEHLWLKPGDGRREWFKDHPNGPEMVLVPAGSFTMGSPEEEEGRFGDEGPQHRVTIRSPFAVGRCAVTFEEWDAAGLPHKPGDRGWGRGRQPVINVSWEDAQAYCAWLSKATGQNYRLLSEAEWEYCCRAGTTTPFWWGSEISTRQANYDGNLNYSRGAKGEYRQRTLPVDFSEQQFGPNPWGLHQVHGNVWEWCADRWHDDDTGTPPSDGPPSDGSAWNGGDASRRVVRGGSWRSSPQDLRSAFRDRSNTVHRYSVRGFRVGRTLTP